MAEILVGDQVIARVTQTSGFHQRLFTPAIGSKDVLPLLDVFKHHATSEKVREERRNRQQSATSPLIIDACNAYWEAQG